MKKILFTLMLVVFNSNVFANMLEINHDLTLSKRNKVANIDINIANGSITIIGYDGYKIGIKEKRIQLTNTEEKSVLKISNNDNNIIINSMENNTPIDLILKVPYTANLNTTLIKGSDINIQNVYGKIEANNHTGAITAVDIYGPLVAETTNSNLMVLFKKFNVDKPSSIITRNGDIEVRLPKESDLILNVKNYNGKFYSGFKTEYKKIESDTNLDKYTSTKINDGNQSLTLTSYDGDIIVRELINILEHHGPNPDPSKMPASQVPTL